MRTLSKTQTGKRLGICIVAAAMTATLSFPSLAFAEVTVNGTVINEGENAVGGGTATLMESVLDMVNVAASELYIDEDLTVNFNGGNEIQQTTVAGSAEVEMNFEDENSVEDIEAAEKANVTINANGNNEFEEIYAYDDSQLTINVTGENDFEFIRGTQNATVTIRGTDCQKRDELNMGDGEPLSAITTQDGNLTIDHVTINLQSEVAIIGTDTGNLSIDTSKIAKDDENVYASIGTGGTMEISESVIDIAGTVSSRDQMTIKHSDVKVAEVDGDQPYDSSPYRVFSWTGIELIDEENGEVKEGDFYGEKVLYVDTDDNDGSDVDLKADGEPAYYKCKSNDTLPKTDDATPTTAIAFLGLASAITALYAVRRQRNELS